MFPHIDDVLTLFPRRPRDTLLQLIIFRHCHHSRLAMNEFAFDLMNELIKKLKTAAHGKWPGY